MIQDVKNKIIHFEGRVPAPTLKFRRAFAALEMGMTLGQYESVLDSMLSDMEAATDPTVRRIRTRRQIYDRQHARH